MSDIKVKAESMIPEFVDLLERMGGLDAFQHTLAALSQISVMYQSTWRRFAGGSPIPGAPRVINSRGGYIRSIQIDDTSPTQKVVFTDYPAHAFVEEGHGEIDLKPGLLSGTKARSGKLGAYNIVHFRHGVPGTSESNRPMPLNVYQLMQKMTQDASTRRRAGVSHVTGRTPAPPPQNRSYQWGQRLPASAGGPRRTKKTSAGEYTWKTGKYTGMVRMDASTSSARSSKYITFRTVSTRSDPASWIVPPVKGVAIRQAVVDTVKPIAEDMLRAAIEEDLK